MIVVVVVVVVVAAFCFSLMTQSPPRPQSPCYRPDDLAAAGQLIAKEASSELKTSLKVIAIKDASIQLLGEGGNQFYLVGKWLPKGWQSTDVYRQRAIGRPYTVGDKLQNADRINATILCVIP